MKKETRKMEEKNIRSMQNDKNDKKMVKKKMPEKKDRK